MKTHLMILGLSLVSSTAFAVDTLCFDSANLVNVRFLNLDIRSEFLPANADVTINNNGKTTTFNSSKVEGIGPIPEGTIPPSSPSSMADGPYLISNFETGTSGERKFVSVWYLAAQENGQVTLTLNKGAGLFGVKEKTLTCSVRKF